MEQNELVINLIAQALDEHNFIKSAIVYGSSLLNPDTRDIDIALFLDSEDGIVKQEHYETLYNIRNALTQSTGYDVDLVPHHTMDELLDPISPLFNPRYNPALSHGKTIKGDICIQQSFEQNIKMSDLSRYVLLDNRTITRRQLCRSLKKEEFSIFLSKLAHTPGNILTYRAIKDGNEYITSPSNIDKSVALLEKLEPEYEIGTFIADIKRIKEMVADSSKIYSEKDILQKARKLMHTFEKVVSKEFYKKDNICITKKPIIKNGFRT